MLVTLDWITVRGTSIIYDWHCDDPAAIGAKQIPLVCDFGVDVSGLDSTVLREPFIGLFWPRVYAAGGTLALDEPIAFEVFRKWIRALAGTAIMWRGTGTGSRLAPFESLPESLVTGDAEALLFSGGIDSMLAAARRHKAGRATRLVQIHLYDTDTQSVALDAVSALTDFEHSVIQTNAYEIFGREGVVPFSNRVMSRDPEAYRQYSREVAGFLRMATVVYPLLGFMYYGFVLPLAVATGTRRIFMSAGASDTVEATWGGALYGGVWNVHGVEMMVDNLPTRLQNYAEVWRDHPAFAGHVDTCGYDDGIRCGRCFKCDLESLTLRALGHEPRHEGGAFAPANPYVGWIASEIADYAEAHDRADVAREARAWQKACKYV